MFGRKSSAPVHGDSGKERRERRRHEHKRPTVSSRESRKHEKAADLRFTSDDELVSVHDVAKRGKGGKYQWRRHDVLDGWVKRNIVSPTGVREGALILVGPRLSGKTSWARKWGAHVYLSMMHCSKAMQSSEDGYVVCDDMRKEYQYAKEVLLGQSVLTVLMDDGKPGRMEWGRPCIWTCDRWDDPRRWSRSMAEFVDETCTVFDMYEQMWPLMHDGPELCVGGGTKADTGEQGRTSVVMEEKESADEASVDEEEEHGGEVAEAVEGPRLSFFQSNKEEGKE